MASESRKAKGGKVKADLTSVSGTRTRRGRAAAVQADVFQE